MNIVPTNTNYTYTLMVQNLNTLVRKYTFLNLQTVGNSVMGKDIYVVKLGIGPNRVFYSSSIHANEWITSILLMKFIEDYCQAYVSDTTLYGYSIRKLFRSSTIYLMPMVNPDGVDLATGSMDSNSAYFKNARTIATQFPDIPFPSGWKANITGVDLNLQFPARVGICKANQVCTGV